MKINFKQIKPKYIVIAGVLSALILLIVWRIYSLKKSNVFAPKPIAEIPKPLPATPLSDSDKQPAVQTEQVKQNLEVPLNMSGRAGLQYVGRHPPFDINFVEDSEEDIQEHPATVDYGSPDPFKFEPDPEGAVSGTGYASPSNQHANEMFAKVA